MDIRNEKNHVFNIKLARLIGLYQTLDPGTVKFRGRNVYHMVMACIMLYMCVSSMILNLSGLYYWTVNMPISIDYIWKAVTSYYLIYKLWIVVHHSNDIWDCLSITRYDFTSFSNRNRHVLNHWRERSVWTTTMYTITYYSSLAFYLASTLVFRKDTLPVKNHDGSFSNYCYNIFKYSICIYLYIWRNIQSALQHVLHGRGFVHNLHFNIILRTWCLSIDIWHCLALISCTKTVRCKWFTSRSSQSDNWQSLGDDLSL